MLLTEKIKQEYKNYMLRLMINKHINDKIKDKIQRKLEYHNLNAFFMYRITRIMFFNSKKSVDIFKYITDDDKKVYEVYFSKDKKIQLQDVIDFINKKDELVDLKNYSGKIKRKKNYIIFNNLKFKLDDRIKYLLNKLKKDHDKTKYKIITILMLRYATFEINSNHCAIMRNVYDYLYNNLGIKGEGFSSPFNSKLIEKNDTIICSLFRDTDRYFGSIGQFHLNVILNNQHINWTLNPPYFYKTIKFCVGVIIYTFENENLKNKNLLVMLVIPETKVINLKKTLYNKFLLGYINNKKITVGKKRI